MDAVDRRALMSAAGLVGVAALAARSKAGPLTPPAGAVAPTGRTLDEVYNRIGAPGAADGRTPLPGGTAGVTISAPGSYVLTGPLTVAGQGIFINASDVTLDLNGYTVTNTTNASSCIGISGTRSRITVRNGRLQGGDVGFRGSSNSSHVTVEDVESIAQRNNGLSLNIAGMNYGVVRRCNVTRVGEGTVSADGSLTILGIGVSGAHARIEDCSVGEFFYNGSGTPTFVGISQTSSSASGYGALIQRCVVSAAAATTGTGIRFFGAGVYRDNTVINLSTPYSGGTNGGGNV
jgi:hypothetical protein